MEEVIERRKWLFTKRKSGGSNAKLRRRPTLSHFLAECERSRRRDSGPSFGHAFSGPLHSDSPASNPPAFDDVNFRLQQRYWGKIHRKTPTPSPSPELGSSEEDEEEEDEEREEEDDQKETVWDEQEEENEILGVHRRTLSLRRKERPLSMGALPDQVRKNFIKK